jgi:hypothetical protein
VFHAEVPHYFRHAFDRGPESVAPRVEYASGLDSPDPRCVVSIVACTGDWTGGWDNSEPGGVDRFITADGRAGRLVEVIERGEPVCLLAHWTGIWFNGAETGFRIFQEVVRRLHARFDALIWMKLAELARYWAARELTAIQRENDRITFRAPFSTPAFTVESTRQGEGSPRLTAVGQPVALREVSRRRDFEPGTWRREGETVTVCFDLPKGTSTLAL